MDQKHYVRRGRPNPAREKDLLLWRHVLTWSKTTKLEEVGVEGVRGNFEAGGRGVFCLIIRKERETYYSLLYFMIAFPGTILMKKSGNRHCQHPDEDKPFSDKRG